MKLKRSYIQIHIQASEKMVTCSSGGLAILSCPSPPPLSLALINIKMTMMMIMAIMTMMMMTMTLLVKVVGCSGHWLPADFSIGSWIKGG